MCYSAPVWSSSFTTFDKRHIKKPMYKILEIHYYNKLVQHKVMHTCMHICVLKSNVHCSYSPQSLQISGLMIILKVLR